MTNPVPEGSIIITPTEVYNEVKSLTEAVRELVARDKAESEDRSRLANEVRELSKRVTAVEQRIWIASGFCAGIGSIAGALVPHLVK